MSNRDNLSLDEILVCPSCKQPLVLPTGSWPLHSELTVLSCMRCQRHYRSVDGAIDFVAQGSMNKRERDHYQAQYNMTTPVGCCSALKQSDWHRRWHDPHWPECEVILRHLGNLAGKLILCVGNGASVKELFFLLLGARVIHSDLSLSGPISAKRQYDLTLFVEDVRFHAIDAYAMPFRDESLDVVYGFEFVHHLSDLPRFLNEAHRVLKPGGQCLFFDTAYSFLWQSLKTTAFWPLMKASHLLHGISPEDLRATYAGGYREADLSELVARQGFCDPFFERTTFFQYLLTRGVGAFVGWRMPHWVYKGPGLIGRCLDIALTRRVKWLSRNRIEMVWGFAKPIRRAGAHCDHPNNVPERAMCNLR